MKKCPSTSSTPRQRIHLPVEAKNIILNVYRYVKEVGKDERPIKKTSIMTNISYATVWRCVNENIKDRKSRIDRGTPRKLQIVRHAHIVRSTIYEMYEEKIVPTLRSLRQKLIIEREIGAEFSVETLRLFLESSGFVLKRINK